MEEETANEENDRVEGNHSHNEKNKEWMNRKAVETRETLSNELEARKEGMKNINQSNAHEKEN